MRDDYNKMSKVKLYLALANDGTVLPWIEKDISEIRHSLFRIRTGDPEIDSLTTREGDMWSSAQKWLAKKKPALKRLICYEWNYCSRRSDYGEDYEKLIGDVAILIAPIVSENLAEIVATILFKESLFTLCECGDLKRLMSQAMNSLEQNPKDEHNFELFARIVDLDPDNHRAHYGLGRVRSAQGRYEEAIPHYKRAMALSPSDPAYLNDLGYIYAEVKNDLEIAQDYVALSLKMVGDHPYNRAACLDSLGWVLCRRGEYREALRCLRESVELVKRSPETFDVETQQEHLYHLAETYRGLGDTMNLKRTAADIRKLKLKSVWTEKLERLLECNQ